MSQTEFKIDTPVGAGISLKTQHETTIKEGESLIIKVWSWRRLGFIQKSVTLKDGKITVEVLSK